MSIGQNLKRLRNEKGISQSELAAGVGISQPMIAQVERGTKSLTLELGKEIADYLGATVDELLR